MLRHEYHANKPQICKTLVRVQPSLLGDLRLIRKGVRKPDYARLYLRDNGLRLNPRGRTFQKTTQNRAYPRRGNDIKKSPQQAVIFLFFSYMVAALVSSNCILPSSLQRSTRRRASSSLTSPSLHNSEYKTGLSMIYVKSFLRK